MQEREQTHMKRSEEGRGWGTAVSPTPKQYRASGHVRFILTTSSSSAVGIELVLKLQPGGHVGVGPVL